MRINNITGDITGGHYKGKHIEISFGNNLYKTEVKINGDPVLCRSFKISANFNGARILEFKMELLDLDE